MTLDTADIGSCRIAYRFDGPADAPVVVLSNSLSSNLSMWDDQFAALTARYRVLRYDQRGHGQSTVTPGPYTFDMLADEPGLGVKRRSRGRAVRTLPHGSHIIIYRAYQSGVEILRIRHQREDWAREMT